MGFADQVSGVAALAEPVRRDLYLFVAAQPEPVSRDQASEGVGIARHTAKFHLDKLVEEGLLDTDYKRLSGRRGPGGDRPGCGRPILPTRLPVRPRGSCPAVERTWSCRAIGSRFRPG